MKKTYQEQIVGHISRDSTEIEGLLEKPVKKVKEVQPVEIQPKRKRGRPKTGEPVVVKEPTRLQRQENMNLDEMLEDLPTDCDVGWKINCKGYTETWNGYKLHSLYFETKFDFYLNQKRKF